MHSIAAFLKQKLWQQQQKSLTEAHEGKKSSTMQLTSNKWGIAVVQSSKDHVAGGSSKCTHVHTHTLTGSEVIRKSVSFVLCSLHDEV